jgi:hypothetical protein
MKRLPKISPASNEHIAKIAAVPSFERNYYFRGGCSLESVWKPQLRQYAGRYGQF